jgi:hypothetical protein
MAAQYRGFREAARAQQKLNSSGSLHARGLASAGRSGEELLDKLMKV